MNIADVTILTDRLSFQPDEITSGTIVLDGNTVQWEIDCNHRQGGPEYTDLEMDAEINYFTHACYDSPDDPPDSPKFEPLHYFIGDWMTYFEGDKQVIGNGDDRGCSNRYLLRYARQLSVTEAVDVRNVIVTALQKKVHPDHCHCQPCEKYHDEVIVPRMIALLRGEFPDVEAGE
jgi:hypothetical protein